MFQPANHTTNLQLPEILSDEYGLTLLSVQPIRFGVWEECFRITADQGIFFAKHFLRRERKKATILTGLALSQALLGRGFPAPRLIYTRKGEPIAEVSGERYQVNEWVEGICYHPGELPLEAAEPMGRLLGRFHRLTGPADVATTRQYTSPKAALEQCAEMLSRYADRSEPFALVAREVLSEQIAILSELPQDFHIHLPKPALGGPCFNSFWIEQVLFKPDGQVAALVDWSDGAGKPAYWIEDIQLGIHLSALDDERLVRFVRGYQMENPLPATEWKALVAMLCYSYLASVNFLGSWLDKSYPRLAQWEKNSELWHRQIPRRFSRWKEIGDMVFTAAKTSGLEFQRDPHDSVG